LKVLRALAGEGIKDFKVYSTHTPYVFEREKAIKVMEKYGVWEKFPMELAYFHEHSADPRRVTTEKTDRAPFGDAKFLNYSDRILSSELKEEIKKLLPNTPSWEMKINFGV
jgi:hypothetical protein